MPPNDSWKDALLSSGVPLETTVAQILSEHGCFVPGEYEFTVMNTDGSQVRRSVDVHGLWHLPAASLQLVVECKYRRTGVRWFFIRQPHAVMGQRDWVTNCLVEPFVPPWYVDHGLVLPPVVRFGHHPHVDQHVLPIGMKGVQLCPGANNQNDRSADETPIKNAQHQVRYAATALQFGFPPLPKAHFEPWLLSDNFTFLLPVIVTSAELHLIKSNTRIDDIKRASDPSEVADRVPALILELDPGTELRHYSSILLRRNYENLLKDPFTMDLAIAWSDRMFIRASANQSCLADLQSLDVPRKVIVAELDSFSALMGSWQRLFSEPDALTPYDMPGAMTGHIAFDIGKRRELHAAKRRV